MIPRNEYLVKNKKSMVYETILFSFSKTRRGEARIELDSL